MDKPIISATEPDWSREACQNWWSPGPQLLKSIRGYQRWKASRNPIAFLMRKYYVFKHRFWSVVSGAEIALNCQIGGGLALPHPNGIVIHPGATIGPNGLIFQQVTIGHGPKPGTPKIGGHVDIGAGAKILGGVEIGDHAQIGANAVVITDVPAYATAVGIPARIIVRAPAAS
jgi:serine O-acetyltransferase